VSINNASAKEVVFYTAFVSLYVCMLRGRVLHGVC